MSESSKGITRREVVKGSAAGLAATVAIGTVGCDVMGGNKTQKMPPNPGNAAFYSSNGAFDPKAVKKAYFAMFRDAGFDHPRILNTFDYFSKSKVKETREIAASFQAHGILLTTRKPAG